MDVTDMVDYNMEILNRHHLGQSFFQISRDDPTDGFTFDASIVAGHPYPKDYTCETAEFVEDLTLRMRLGSHLAMYMRHQLEQQKGYTSTVGIATSKLLSKLVGSLNKPKGQTTLMPPLAASEEGTSNAQIFMDGHEISKVPGIGFKLAQKLREFVLQRPAAFQTGLVYGGTKENITVAKVRSNEDINPEMLEKLLGGPGSPHGIGFKIWCLLHGIDDTKVSQAKVVPSQISIEDSYIRLDTMPEVLRELNTLTRSLICRMRIDLLGDEEPFQDESDDTSALPAAKKWLAHPKTLRLTTRPRQPLQPDGTRQRSFKRISHSAPLPNVIFNLSESIDAQAERLVSSTIVNMFRKLHPEKSGWNLSLVNLAVTNMAETAGDSKTANGRDIGNMFRRQEDVLKDFRVIEESPISDVGEESNETTGELWHESQSASSAGMNKSKDCEDQGRSAEEAELGSCNVRGTMANGFVDMGTADSNGAEDAAGHDELDDWNEDAEVDDDIDRCEHCGARMPSFAMIAHRRFHKPLIDP